MKVEVKNVTKIFKNNVVIDSANITFHSGKIYGLIGRNGSGKSVFLKMLCGFYIPTSGKILFDGIDYIEKNGFPLNTRALIEKPDFLPDLSGYDNLKLLASIQNKIGKEEILNALSQVNLTEDKDKKYSKYSLGMKQKLGIAQALMEDPECIILDEPFNGIENATASKVRKLLKQRAKDGKTIIIATHIKEDIDELADYTYSFNNGNLELQ